MYRRKLTTKVITTIMAAALSMSNVPAFNMNVRADEPYVSFDGESEVGDGEEPEPVEPMENETFEEPQGPVVTVDELI